MPGLASWATSAVEWARHALAAADRKLADRRIATAALVTSTAAVFLFRLPAVLQRPAAGIDYGHYLATAHWLTGQEPTQFGNDAPFGYHGILALLMAIMPEPTATVVSGPLVAALLVPAGFLLARKAVGPLAALACGGLLACMQNISDMIAWGGNPNLVALAFSLVAWRFMLDALEGLKEPKAPLRPALLAGIFVGLTILTHFFTAFLTLVTMGGFIAAAAGLRFIPVRRLGKPLLFGGLSAGLVAAPAAPLYSTLVFQGSLSAGLGGVAAVQSTLDSTLFLHRDTPALWLAAWVLTVIGASTLLARRNLFGLYLAVAALAPLVLSTTLLSAHPSRTLYFLDPPVALGAAAGAFALWSGRGRLPKAIDAFRKPAVLAFAVACLVLVPPSSLFREGEAVAFYNHMSADDLLALEWIRLNSAHDQAVWTNGLRDLDPESRTGQSIGFWIEGYARRPAVYTARPEDLAFAYQQERARDANRFFQGDAGAENGWLRVGVGSDLSVALQPTVGFLTGLDYRQLVTGGDLALEASAEAYSLAQGVAAPNLTTNVSGARVFFNETASFSAPNNWSGAASASLELDGASVSYRIDARSNGPELPWIHKEFRLTPFARLEQSAPLENGSVLEFVYRIPITPGQPASPVTVSFRVSDPSSALSVERFETTQGDLLKVLVSGSAPQPSLTTTITWGDPPTTAKVVDPPRLFVGSAILASRLVAFLFVEKLETALVQRFDAQPARFTRAFENAGVVVYAVHAGP